MKDNNGGPAFPCTEANYTDSRWTAEGISIRDYFAAKAMQGLLASKIGNELARSDLAQYAYMQADAMLKEREID